MSLKTAIPTSSESGGVEPDRQLQNNLVARASVSLVTSRAAQSALWFFFVLAVARLAGPVARGGLAFVMATVSLLQIGSSLGLDIANLHFAGKDPALRKKLAGTSLFGGLAFGALLAVLAWGIFLLRPNWVPKEISAHLLVFSLLTTPFMSAHLLLFHLLVGSRRLTTATLLRIAIPAMALIALMILALVFGRVNIPIAIAAWSAGNMLGFLLAIGFAVRHIGIVVPSTLLGDLKGFLRYGLPAHVGQLADLATFRTDALILAASRGAAELGIYAAAVNIAEVIHYLSSSVSAALITTNAGRAEDTGRTTLRVLALVIAASTGAAVLGIILAPHLVRFLFGEGFAPSSTPLRVLFVAVVGSAMGRVLWAGLVSTGRRLLASATTVGTLCTVVILDLILIPRLGAVGAALASAAAYWIGGLLTLVVFRVVFPTRASVRWSDLHTDTKATLTILKQGFRRMTSGLR
jgi:O-antigen/teichoic acid export membrane protein